MIEVGFIDKVGARAIAYGRLLAERCLFFIRFHDSARGLHETRRDARARTRGRARWPGGRRSWADAIR